MESPHSPFARSVRRPRRGPHQTSSTRAVCRQQLHTGSEASSALLVRFARRGRRGRSPQTHCRCCPFYGSQGCPSLARAAGFVQGGSCARVFVVSLPLGPCLPPQLAFAVTRSSCLRTLNRSKFCHGSHAPGGRLRGPRDGAGAVLQFKFEKNRPSFVRT